MRGVDNWHGRNVRITSCIQYARVLYLYRDNSAACPGNDNEHCVVNVKFRLRVYLFHSERSTGLQHSAHDLLLLTRMAPTISVS